MAGAEVEVPDKKRRWITTGNNVVSEFIPDLGVINWSCEFSDDTVECLYVAEIDTLDYACLVCLRSGRHVLLRNGLIIWESHAKGIRILIKDILGTNFDQLILISDNSSKPSSSQNPDPMHVSIKDLGVVRLKRLRSLCNENQIADFHEMNVEIIDFLRNGAVGVVNVEEKEKAVSIMLFVHNAILREQISVQNNISNLKSQIDRLRSRISGHSSDINYITIPEQGTSFNISNVEGNQESDNSWKDDILLSDLEIVVDMNMNWLYVDCTATNNSKSELHSISLQLFFTDSTQSQQSVQNFNSTTFPLRPSDSTTLTSKILIPPNFLISNNHQSTPLLKMTVFWKRKPTAVDINANESIKDDELRAENDTIPTFFHKDVESIAISPEFLNSKRCEHYKFGLDMVLLAKDNLSSSAAVNSLCEYCRMHQYTKCEDGWFTKKTQTTRIDIGLNFHTTNGQPMNRVNATAAPIAILTIYSTSQTAHETILHINQLQNSLPDSIFLKLLTKCSQGLFLRFNRFQDGVLVVDGVKDGGKRVKKVKVVDEFLDLESVEKLEGIVGRLRGNPMLELLMETQESLFG